MNNQDIINEEKYQKSKRKIKMISIIVLIVGLSLGGFLSFLYYYNTKFFYKSQ